jgi:hypothetical protein
MRMRAPRYPKATSIAAVVAALRDRIPIDESPRLEWRYSDNGQPNLRYQATTRHLPWLVDIYIGHYYRVQVGTQLGDVCRSIPSLIGYLAINLGLVSKDPGDAR